MEVIGTEQAAVFETPNAVMRTYASPAVNDAALAVWRTEMAPGAEGPWHAVSEDQILVVVGGELCVDDGAAERSLGAGDAVVLRAGEERRIANRGDEPATSVTSALPGALAKPRDRPEVPVPWAT